MYCAQMQIKPGMKVWHYAAGQLVYESRRFVWQIRCLPIVDRHSCWDGKSYRWIWLRWATLRGTKFGWETAVDQAHYDKKGR